MAFRDKNQNTGNSYKEEDPYKQKKDLKKLFSPEGSVVYFLTKAGQVMLLNIIWFLSCIPIVTIGTATTSLYYAMMKNIRRNRSYPTTDYFASFKRTLKKGCALTFGILIWLLLLYHLQTTALATESATGLFLNKVYQALFVVTAAIVVYLFPVLSRFTLSLTGMLKLSFVMAVRYMGYTIVILVGTAALIWLWIYVLPMPTIFVWPGAWCFVCTFMIEKALRKYMPAPNGNEDAWYYE